MMIKNYIDDFKENVPEYAGKLKSIGKGAVLGGTLLAITAMPSLFGEADVLNNTLQAANNDEIPTVRYLQERRETEDAISLDEYIDKHVSEEKEEMVVDLYNFIIEGEEERGFYPMERYEIGFERLAEMHTSGEATESGEDKEIFAEKTNQILDKLGDFVYGEADGYAEEEEINKIFNELDDNKFLKEVSRQSIDNEIERNKIRHVQNLLNNYGYDAGTVDGTLESRTEYTLKTFQKVNNLDMTGDLCNQTLESLVDPKEPEPEIVLQYVEDYLLIDLDEQLMYGYGTSKHGENEFGGGKLQNVFGIATGDFDDMPLGYRLISETYDGWKRISDGRGNLYNPKDLTEDGRVVIGGLRDLEAKPEEGVIRIMPHQTYTLREDYDDEMIVLIYDQELLEEY